MNYILLSGGYGTRLWPLSNGIRSKQFIKLFKDKRNQPESMVQRIYRQIRSIDKESDIFVAAPKSQIAFLHNQLGNNVCISEEPCGKDTFPAIALACAFLYDIKKIPLTDAVVVCPVDTFAEKKYFQLLHELGNMALSSSEKLLLLGITPNMPSEKYGYIFPTTTEPTSTVDGFKEKPSRETAEIYIKQGALWNSGAFAFRLEYMKEKAAALLGSSSYKTLYAHYEKLEKISFDYAVTEKEKHIGVVRFEGAWQDIGTWNALVDSLEMREREMGTSLKVFCDTDVNVINELNIPILCMGIQNTIVAASPDGIMVADRAYADDLKPYVEQLSPIARVMETQWGECIILNQDENATIIKKKIYSGMQMLYSGQGRFHERWIILSGKGQAAIGDEIVYIKSGDVIMVQKEKLHTIRADISEELVLIEIQIKENILC